VEVLEPFLKWEHIFERIQEFLGYLTTDERELTWFEVEKWSPDGTGRLKNDYVYTVLGARVCYFERNSSSSWERNRFSTNCNLNLPVPFRIGDIVTVDCRPFAPVSRVVILEVGDNRDCCCFQALFRKGDGNWGIGAVKHGNIFSNHNSPELSPLYRLTSFRGQLSKDEQLLEKVSQYLNTDEERGAALWNYIYCSRGKDRSERKMTEAQILSYI